MVLKFVLSFKIVLKQSVLKLLTSLKINLHNLNSAFQKLKIFQGHQSLFKYISTTQSSDYETFFVDKF